MCRVCEPSSTWRCVHFYSQWAASLSRHAFSHEVRNPLSAALSACSFVSTEIDKSNPLQDEKSRESVREDFAIVNQSLQFINDLLRSMLDYHRATSRQMKIEPVPTDILRDVLEPTAAMLYNRSDNFEILVDCPENLVVMTDGLRFKQITLNLARNSAKFVSKGFIRFRVVVGEDKISLAIEDSGCGIPESKRGRLFQKWQETLDSLSQGSGSLCCCTMSLSSCQLVFSLELFAFVATLGLELDSVCPNPWQNYWEATCGWTLPMIAVWTAFRERVS